MSELQLLKVEFPAPEGSPHPTNGIKSYTNISWKSPTSGRGACAPKNELMGRQSDSPD